VDNHVRNYLYVNRQGSYVGRPRWINQCRLDSFPFQKWINLVSRLDFFGLTAFTEVMCSDIGLCSMESLLLSPNEPPISLERLAILALLRRRSIKTPGIEHMDPERSP